MTSTTSLEDLAVRGRRVLFTYFRDLGEGPEHPGIITGTERGYGGALRSVTHPEDNDDCLRCLIRIDGTRSTLSVPADYEGLNYLDEVVPVPALPMGPFTPTADDKNAIYEKNGVLFATIGEDGEDLVIITDDRAKAWAVVSEYFRENRIDIDPDFVDADDLQLHWAVFEWEPEDAECPWTVRVDAREDEAHVTRIYFLPTS